VNPGAPFWDPIYYLLVCCGIYLESTRAIQRQQPPADGNNDDEISVIAGTKSDDDVDMPESDDDDSVDSVVPEQDDSIARQVNDQAFIDEMTGLLKTNK
jgi:hypothetical protein